MRGTLGTQLPGRTLRQSASRCGTVQGPRARAGQKRLRAQPGRLPHAQGDRRLRGNGEAVVEPRPCGSWPTNWPTSARATSRRTRSRCIPAGSGFSVCQDPSTQQPRGAEPWILNRGCHNCSTSSATLGGLQRRSAPRAPSCCRRAAAGCRCNIVEAQLDAQFPAAEPASATGGGSGRPGSCGGRGHGPGPDGRPGRRDG
jgi:hypothetical protein